MRGCCLLLLLMLGACAPRIGPSDIQQTADRAAVRPFAGTDNLGASKSLAADPEAARASRVQAIAARVRQAASAFCAAGAGAEAAGRVPLLRPASDCDFPVSISESTDVNAYSDGYKVRVTTALVNFAVDDAELAFVIAHEMAHNLIHVGPGAFRGPRRQQEYQADHMGLYLVARAGYSPGTAIRLLARLASRNSTGRRLHPDYPPFNARHDKLPEVVARISGKKAAGRPLFPEHLVTELVARRAD